MALASKAGKTSRKAATKKTTPKETETTKETAPVEEKVETPVENQEPAPVENDPVPERAVVTATTKAVSATGRMQLALGDFKNALPPIDFGTLPRIKASQGALVCEDEVLGKEAEVSIVSYNDSFAITPNENNAESHYCKFSYDNVVLNDGSGRTVDEHLAYLRDEGFENAAAKRYIELVVMLEDADEDSDEIGNMVQVSLSPQSVKQFERYQLQTTIKQSKGDITADQAAQVKLTAKTKTFGKNTFTLISFSQQD